MNKTKIVLFDIDYTLFDTDIFKTSGLKTYKLYDETIGVLKKIAEFAEIGIFSQGEDEFQREKLNKTLISNNFQEKNIHIFLNKDDNLEKVLRRYKNSTIFLVDDKLKVLQLAKDFDSRVFTIWIKRGPFAEKEDEEKGISANFVASDLKEIIPLILNS